MARGLVEVKPPFRSRLGANECGRQANAYPYGKTRTRLRTNKPHMSKPTGRIHRHGQLGARDRDCHAATIYPSSSCSDAAGTTRRCDVVEIERGNQKMMGRTSHLAGSDHVARPACPRCPTRIVSYGRREADAALSRGSLEKHVAIRNTSEGWRCI